MRRHRTLICIAVEMVDVSSAYATPCERFSQLAGPKVPFLRNENQELGEKLVASHVDQVHPCHWLEADEISAEHSPHD